MSDIFYWHIKKRFDFFLYSTNTGDACYKKCVEIKYISQYKCYVLLEMIFGT